MSAVVLLLAKDAEAAGLVSHAFWQRSITKYYYLVSAGRARKKQGGIEDDIPIPSYSPILDYKGKKVSLKIPYSPKIGL